MKINQAYIEFFNSDARYAVLRGGAGSGKSIATMQKTLLRITTEPNHRILCLRKVAKTLRNSIYQGLIDMMLDEDVYKEFIINKSEMRFTHSNGNEIILCGMDDPEKIKSIVGITAVWCEEATEFEELDFNQLELRVRGATTNYKQFILTFNPISDEHWLKKRFFDNPDDQTFLLVTTYKDNAFLDSDYIKHLKQRVRINPNLYKVYVLGEWGKTDFGGEFLKCWSSVKHVGCYKYNPDLAIYLSLDENVNPYFPCGIFQIGLDNKTVNLIDVITAKNPDNTVRWMGREIVRKLTNYGHKGKVYVCGDATSQKADVKQEKGHDLFKLLMLEIRQYNPIRKVATSNPSVIVSANFFNAILEYNEQQLTFNVDEGCRSAILDYENTKEDKNGLIDKSTVSDPVTHVNYQPYGHIVDLTRYFICYVFNKEYRLYQTGNKPHQMSTGKNRSKNDW